MLRHVKQCALEAQEHQDLPFEHVVELIKPVRSLSYTPLFQVMFAWQNNKAETLDLGPDLSVTVADAAYMTAKFDLTLELREADGRIVGGLRYATALFDRETAERHADYLREVLRGMAQDTSQDRAQAASSAGAGAHASAAEWNATATDYPRESVHP